MRLHDSSRAAGLAVFLSLAAWPGIGPAATLTVTSTADSGLGTLRQAILDANATNGLDEIVFSVSGTITVASALPTLVDQVVLNATTHPGYSNHPVVELNGASAGSGVVGLRLGSRCEVRGLAIGRFSADGLLLEGSNNLVRACFIGTDMTGTLPRGNGQYGVFVYGGSGNVIGGTNVADRNVISDNDTGIYVLNSTASSNRVWGNFIGTTASGTVALGNRNNGITLYAAPANVIGGSSPGSGNVISGNGGSGINANTAGSGNLVIEGNHIGTDVSGTVALGNAADGVTLNGVGGCRVGGATPGLRNVISGNGQAGVFLSGAGAVSNSVQGNFIGTDVSGQFPLGNTFSGVTLSGASGNVVGGAGDGMENVISGNRLDGVFLTAGSTGNRILGNLIGVAQGGSNLLGNSFDGVGINSASSNIVGGAEVGARNLISGNTNNGVLIFGPGAIGNAVLGNLIGTDVTGRSAIRNTQSGVRIESADNQLGGAGAAGNVISGNGAQGIWLVGTNATGNRVQGNLVGLKVAGTNGLANGKAGIGITDGSDNLIGGAGGLGNVVSANAEDGVFVMGSAGKANRLEGNRIGTDAAGNAALANGISGIYIQDAVSNSIGGLALGAGNQVSGNRFDGIWLVSSAGNVVQGNLVGTRADGAGNLGNGNYALELDAGANHNLIGGELEAAGNRFAFSQGPYVGVRVRDGAVNNGILRNSIFSNGALGIDLGAYGVTANDPCDPDSGGNQWQNFPVLTQAYSGGNTGVRGTLNSQSSKVYRVQFFSNPACDSSGYGEGQTFLGEINVATGPGCATNFTASLPVAVPVGQVVTATATDPSNNTSEFSACMVVQPLPRLGIAYTSGPQITLAWTNTAVGFGLKQTDNLTPPVAWVPVTNVPSVSGGQFLVTLSPGGSKRFYRLNLE